MTAPAKPKSFADILNGYNIGPIGQANTSGGLTTSIYGPPRPANPINFGYTAPAPAPRTQFLASSPYGSVNQTTGAITPFRSPTVTAPTGGGTNRTAAVTAPSAPAQDTTAQDLALAAWNAARQQAQDVRNQGQRTFDTIMKSISDFRDRALTLKNNAGQEITNTSADILGSNATNAQQLAGTLNAQGRNLGLSSKLNLGTKLLSNLQGTQGNTLARKGEQVAANNAQYQDRQGQADTQGNQANNYLQQINDSANQVETAGVGNYGSALNNILNYQRSLASINPLNSGGLTQLTPDFSNIKNTLATVLNGTGGAGVGGNQPNTTDQFSNPSSPVDIYSLLKRQGLIQ